MTKKEYLCPEVEVFALPKAMQLLAALSLDMTIEDFEGDEIEGF